jgi:Homeodomain-like domain
MNKKYRIHLSQEERRELQELIKTGKAAASKRQRAGVLLAADESHPAGGMSDEQIARALEVSVPTVERTRCALAEHGLQVAVQGWPVHRKAPRGKVDGWAEAHLVAATCSAPPAGHARWTLRLLGDHLIGLGLVDALSNQTVMRVLKKTSSNPGR